MTRPHAGRSLAATLLVLATAWGGTAAASEEDERGQPARKVSEADGLEKAEEQGKQAIVAARKLGPDHLAELAEAFAGLADVYLKQGRMTEANLLLEQSLLLLAQTP